MGNFQSFTEYNKQFIFLQYIFKCKECQKIPLITPFLKNNHINLRLKCKCGIKTMTSERFLENSKITKMNSKIPICFREKFHKLEKNNEKKNKSIIFCIECQKWLCHSCLSQHDEFVDNHHFIYSEIIMDVKCHIHTKEKAKFYCKNCSEKICKSCTENHKKKNHNVIKLKDIIPNDNFSNILNEFKQVVNEFKDNSFRSKQMIVNQLNDEITKLKTAINKIETAYKKNYMINYELSILIENIIQNYRLSMIIPDYNNIMNYINNTKYSPSLKFNGYDSNSIDNSINNLISFYDSNYLIPIKEKNFYLNKLELVKSITGIKQDINSLIIMHDKRLAAAEEKIIKIFEMDENLNYKYDIKIEGHTANVHYLCNMKDNKLLSSSADKTIKIWIISKSTYTCETTLEGHYKWVFNVIQLNNLNIASCSLDNTIKIWNGNFPYTNIKTLTGHTHGVTCIIQIKDGRIVSGSNDDSIRFWNMSTYECIENQTIYDVICCKMDSITQIDDCRLCVGGWKFLTIININTYQIITKIEIHNDEINAVLYLDNGSLISGSNDGFIKQIDINNFKNDDYGAIKTRDNINCIRKFGDNCIICAGKGIKIFKLKE